MKPLKCYAIKDLKSIPKKYLSLFNLLYKRMNLLQGFSWDSELTYLEEKNVWILAEERFLLF